MPPSLLYGIGRFSSQDYTGDGHKKQLPQKQVGARAKKLDRRSMFPVDYNQSSLIGKT
jgi:hypothetical protein